MKNFLLILTLGFLLFGCVTTPEAPIAPPPVVEEKPVTQTPTPEAFPAKGWPVRYDEIMEAAVKDHPGLLTVNASRLQTFCPKWSSLTKEQKIRFYVDTAYAIAGPESAWDRQTLYWEDTMGMDKKTGLPVTSDGLFQLSYQDSQWYAGCKFDAEKDRALIQADWAARGGRASWKSKTLNRDTSDPQKSMACMAFVMNRLLTSATHQAKSFEMTLGQYWSVMRPTVKKEGVDVPRPAHQQVKSNLKKRGSPCT